MASEEEDVRIGDRVEVKGKDLIGTVKFYGTTEFAPAGRWIGVALDELKGRNNGTVQGKEYFRCPDNHGLFVRRGQVNILPATHPGKKTGALATSKSGLLPPKSMLPRKLPSPSSSPGLVKKKVASSSAPAPSDSPASTLKISTKPAPEKEQSSAVPPPVQQSVPVVEGDDPRLKDLSEKLAILQHKRQEDKARIKELERYKAQCQQLLEYKQKWSEAQTELQQQLKAVKKEAKEAVEEKRKTEEEMRDLGDSVEMSTLDKEMAEEKCESLQVEVEALKEKVEELTLDLDIVRNEISESGVEGAASNFQMKQLEQQNQRLKEALVRLRDMSAQDKNEHQQLVKDLEKQVSLVAQLSEQKDLLQEELQEAEATVDELKEQVDASLGAEEMVETLTEKTLDLEEKVTELQEQVDDLEALKELGEEQEELRVEMELELREELDLSYNKSGELEHRIEASQEVIVDLQQTVEKFRELVRSQQGSIVELKQKEEESQKGQGEEEHSKAFHSLSRQLQATTIKAHSRTIEFELRKLEAQQAAEHIKLLKSFMPNSFLAGGGDYDVLMVVMLLPRIVFKAELICSQLRLQYKSDEVIEARKPLPGMGGDCVVFAAHTIAKLTTFQFFVRKVQTIVDSCDVGLYRQLGGLRDDLMMHEKSLDHLISALKTEQLDNSVPLESVDKAIGHFKTLLETRLVGVAVGHSLVVTEQMKMLTSTAEAITMETMRVRSFVPDGCIPDTQLKDFDSLAADVRVTVRKVRRRIPVESSGKTLQLSAEVLEEILNCNTNLEAVRESLTQLKTATGRKGNVLSEGEKLQSGVVEDLLQQASSSCLTLVKTPTPAVDKIRASFEWIIATLNTFANAVQNGDFDQDMPRSPIPPYAVRATSVKNELSDAEGLGYRLEEKNKEFVELKKAIRQKGEEVAEGNIRISLMEKKVESAVLEGERKAEVEREEITRLKEVIEQKDTRFERAIHVLQNDIDSLEREKLTLSKALEEFKKTKGSHSGVSAIFKSLGKQDSSSASGDASSAQSPLLKEKIQLLKDSLTASHTENHRLRARLARLQMAALPPLKLLSGQPNETDQQKTVGREVSILQKELLVLAATPKVVDITKGLSTVTGKKSLSPQEQYANQLSHLLNLQKKTQDLKSKAAILLANQVKGGVVQTPVGSFVSPNFSQVLQDATSPHLVARLKMHQSSSSTSTSPVVCPVVLDPNQWRSLHRELVK
uniref:Dynactin subunit 1 n=1 Tax=Halisarca dujardinii TaxID=2583056 RepID=A0A9F1U3Y4_HALDU|nr:dynactin 1 [Halisarca dujardinii]